jgi:hypothetical protein
LGAGAVLPGVADGGAHSVEGTVCLVIATEASSDVGMRGPWETLDAPKALNMWGKLRDGAPVDTDTHVDAVDFRVMLVINLQLTFLQVKDRR